MTRIDPVQGVLTILDEAKMTGTNKLSLLLAILDLAPITPPAGLMLVDDIVDKTLELHWNHTEDFPFSDGVRPVRQMNATNGENISAVLRVAELKSSLERNLKFEIARARISDQEWKTAQSKLRKSLLANPIKYLQVLPGNPPNFLFDLTPDSKYLQFFPGVLEDLVRWGGVLRPVIELHYLNFVLSSNKTESHQQDLYNFLFGEERSMPNLTIRQKLWDIQGGVCLYTGNALPRPTGSNIQSLDHVVPWSRMRLSVMENFVLTHDKTNNEKRALLLDYETLHKWREHTMKAQPRLIEISQEHAWPTDMHRVLQGLGALYSTAIPPLTWGPTGVKQMTESEQSKVVDLLHAS